jgi:hypothetical protein
MKRPGLASVALVIILVTLLPFGNATVKHAAGAPHGNDDFGGSATTRGNGGFTTLLTLPLAGTTHGNGGFTGTLTITNVVAQGADIFVEGVVAGTVTRSSQEPLGTIFSVPVRLPLTGNWHQVASLRPGPERGIVLAQSTCGVLHLSIGAVDLNVLGVVVTTTPITLDVSGNTAGPLGSLVCTILNLVTTVTGLLNSLTSLLGGLGGALGGVGGGTTGA